MIDVALAFLCDQVKGYLLSQLNPPPVDDPIILLNVSQLGEGNNSSGNNGVLNAFLSLVNIEEDRISKSHENVVRRDNGTIVYKNPKIFLNLYALFSVKLNSYEESLKRLSLIIQFFQYRNVFDSNNSPTLDPKIDKLIVDMYSMGFEQINNLWGTLGGKYIPSVLYKIRLVIIEDLAIEADGQFIKSIGINDK